MVVANFALLSGLLVVAHVLRAKLTFLRRLYLPSSLIGGLLGFTLLSLIKLNPTAEEYVRTEISVGWSELPSFLTNIVFVTLVLGESIPSLREVRIVSGPQLCYAQILAYGQYAISAFLCWVWFEPVYNVDPIFAAIVPVGFEGGHGVAAGLKHSFDRKVETKNYFDLAMIAATFGLLAGTLVGWATVNLGLRYNLFQSKKSNDINTVLNWWTFNGVYNDDDRPIMGRQTVATESIDSLALHIGVVGVSMSIGWGTKVGLEQLETQVPWLHENEVFTNFPMFPFSLMGALLVQALFDCLGKNNVVALDRSTMLRISGASMDFLVLAAITELDVSVPSDALTPFFIIITCCCVWSVVAMITIGRLLPDLWLERALTETGMCLGATATALLVLRMIDPDNNTILLRSFCFKQIFHVMMVGGGIFTSTSMLTLKSVGPMGMFFISTGLLLLWLLLLWLMSASDRKKHMRAIPLRNAPTVSTTTISSSSSSSQSSKPPSSEQEPLLGNHVIVG